METYQVEEWNDKKKKKKDHTGHACEKGKKEGRKKQVTTASLDERWQ